MSSPMSVSMMTFSGDAEVGEDWAALAGAEIRIVQSRVQMRIQGNFDMGDRLCSAGCGTD
jgi:hypothetical protein